MTTKTITIDPAATKQERLIDHERQLVCCRFSVDGTSLFAAGFDGQLHRFGVADESHDAFAAAGGWIESIELAPDGKQLFTADSWGQLRCWSIEQSGLKVRWSIEGAHSRGLRDLAVSGDGKQLATCGNDRMVRVFSAADGKRVCELKGHACEVQSVAFAGDANVLVSGDLQGIVKQWDLAKGRCVRDLDAGKLSKTLREYRQGGVRCMAFDPGFQTLYCAGFEGTTPNQGHGVPTVVALEFSSGKQQLVMTPNADFKGPILDVHYHPAGYVIGVGSSEGGGAAWFWKPGEAKESHLLKHPTSFRGFDLAGDGLMLAATAFGDRGGQRGGNGRRLNKQGEYIGFAGHIVLYRLAGTPK